MDFNFCTLHAFSMSVHGVAGHILEIVITSIHLVRVLMRFMHTPANVARGMETPGCKRYIFDMLHVVHKYHV